MTQPQTPGEAITRAAKRHADTVEATRALSRALAEERQGQGQGETQADTQVRP